MMVNYINILERLWIQDLVVEEYFIKIPVLQIDVFSVEQIITKWNLNSTQKLVIYSEHKAESITDRRRRRKTFYINNITKCLAIS